MFRAYVNNHKYLQCKSFYKAHQAYQFKNNCMSIPKPLEINDIAEETLKNKSEAKALNSKLECTKHNASTSTTTISNIERGSYQLCDIDYNDRCYTEIKHLKDFNEENKKISLRFEIPMREATRIFNVNSDTRFDL